MTRQEQYNKLIERLGAIENFEKRPRAIWTESERKINTQREELEGYLKIIEHSNGNEKRLAESGFDKQFKDLWAKLDKDGWK